MWEKTKKIKKLKDKKIICNVKNRIIWYEFSRITLLYVSEKLLYDNIPISSCFMIKITQQLFYIFNS